MGLLHTQGSVSPGLQELLRSHYYILYDYILTAPVNNYDYVQCIPRVTLHLGRKEKERRSFLEEVDNHYR